jgi:hypothetical protein
MLGEGYCVEDLPDLVGTMPTLVLLSSDGNVGTTFAGPWLNIFANEVSKNRVDIETTVDKNKWLMSTRIAC